MNLLKICNKLLILLALQVIQPSLGQERLFARRIFTSTTLVRQVIRPIVIESDGITLDCLDNVIVPVPESFFGIPNFLRFYPGIAIVNRRNVKIKNCVISNFLHGIYIENSDVELENVVLQNNTAMGIEASDASRILITGSMVATGNGAFGINALNDCTLTLRDADVRIFQNSLGVQVGLRGSLYFDADLGSRRPPSRLSCYENTFFGLTITSSSHMFFFGNGTLMLEDNGTGGMLVFSKSAVELDRDATLIARNNGEDGVIMDDSTMNMFTIDPTARPVFTSSFNGGSGVLLGKSAVWDTNDDAIVSIEDNGKHGVVVDQNSIAAFLNANITGHYNAGEGYYNVKLTFGSQAEFFNNTIGDGGIACDATTVNLIRGDESCSTVL